MEKIRETILHEMRLAEAAGRVVRVADISQAERKELPAGVVILAFIVVLKPADPDHPPARVA